MLHTLSCIIPYIKKSNIIVYNKDNINHNLFKKHIVNLFKKHIVDTSKVTYKYNDEIKYYNQNYKLKKNNNWKFEW